MVNILNITRHTIKDKRLAPWVKFLWQIDALNADLHYKLLPTDCIDIILNLADDMVYETEFDKIVAPSFHINGLRSDHSFIHQENTIRRFGWVPLYVEMINSPTIGHIVDKHTIIPMHIVLKFNSNMR